MSNGKLITFEGIECSGKGVQSQKLLDHFGSSIAILVREPGGTLYGEALRALIKHPRPTVEAIAEKFLGHEDFPNNFDIPEDLSRSPYCELFMFAAARAEFIAKVVKPALTSGKIVICDRFYDSTRAYQGGGRFHSGNRMIEAIKHINRIASEGVVPDLTIFIDISVEEMIKRRQKESDKDAHFETTCDHNFFERVRREYLRISLDEPDRFQIVEGHQTIDEVFSDILKLAQNLGR